MGSDSSNTLPLRKASLTKEAYGSSEAIPKDFLTWQQQQSVYGNAKTQKQAWPPTFLPSPSNPHSSPDCHTATLSTQAPAIVTSKKQKPGISAQEGGNIGSLHEQMRGALQSILPFCHRKSKDCNRHKTEVFFEECQLVPLLCVHFHLTAHHWLAGWHIFHCLRRGVGAANTNTYVRHHP